MSTTIKQSHIAYELLDRAEPSVVVIAFETPDLSDPVHGRELGEELDSMICPDLPVRFVIDFEDVRAMGSTAFCELEAFARRVRWWGGRVEACNLDPCLMFGASLSGLDEQVEFAGSLRAAVAMARMDAGHPVFVG
jgi:anti-anti-sigma regulatory factor